MGLLSVFRNPSDTGDGALNLAQITAALVVVAGSGGSLTGLMLEPGLWNLRSNASGVVASIPVNNSFEGFTVTPGGDPVTFIQMVGSDMAGAGYVLGNAGNTATGVAVRNLDINGGRTMGWATGRTGAIISLAGQGDYPVGAARHGAVIENCRLRDGILQATSINSMRGVTLNRVFTYASASPGFGSHYCDFDSVANDKPSEFIDSIDCDFDAYGQESVKMENARNMTFTRCAFRMYVTMTQDMVDCNADLDNIVFDRCTFATPVGLGQLKRRRIPGNPWVNDFPVGSALVITATNVVGGAVTNSSGYTFNSGHIGLMVGFYSGVGTGALIISAVSGGNITGGTVVDVFSSLTLPSWSGTGTPRWVIAATDNNGGGNVVFKNSTFTEDGVIFASQVNPANYGLITIEGNTFHKNGNSYVLPPGVTSSIGGNVNGGLPTKRFVRAVANPRFGPFQEGSTGWSPNVRRANATTIILNAINAAQTGEEVRVCDGYYIATSVGNRSINCGGKAITIRPDTMFGAVFDLGVGAVSGYQGVASSADPVGSLIWGIVFANAGYGSGGGNGIGISITGGNLTCRYVAAIHCKTANNGPGIKVTGGSPTIEDFWVTGCNAQATTGALYVVAASGAPTLRRGHVLNNVSAGGTAAGARFGTAGLTIDGLEVTGNVATVGTGGVIFTVGSASVKGLSAYGNTGASAHDVAVGNSITVTAESWILWSDNGTAIKSLAVTAAPAGVVNSTNCTIRTSSGTVNGVVSTADPLFIDLVGRNLQLAPTSPARSTGEAAAGRFDGWNRPFVTPDRGAWA